MLSLLANAEKPMFSKTSLPVKKEMFGLGRDVSPQARTQGGALGERAPPHLGKKFRSEMSKRGGKVSP